MVLADTHNLKSFGKLIILFIKGITFPLEDAVDKIIVQYFDIAYLCGQMCSKEHLCCLQIIDIYLNQLKLNAKAWLTRCSNIAYGGSIHTMSADVVA